MQRLKVYKQILHNLYGTIIIIIKSIFEQFVNCNTFRLTIENFGTVLQNNITISSLKN